MDLEEKGRTRQKAEATAKIKLDLRRRETELAKKMEQLEVREKEIGRKLSELKILNANMDGIKGKSRKASSARKSIDLEDQAKLNLHTSPQLFTAQTLSIIVQAAASPKLGGQQPD